MRSRVAGVVAASIVLFAVVAGCGVSLSDRGASPMTPSAVVASPLHPVVSGSPVPPLPVAPSLSGVPAPHVPSPAPPAVPAPPATTVAAAQVAASLPAFDAYAAATFAQSRVPGAALAVIAGDRAVYVRCFGVREAGRRDAVDRDTLFQLGAVSQSLTSAMLASLVGDGVLSWDEPVARILPGFRLQDPWVSRTVTIRDLLADRTGMPALAGDELHAFGYGRAEILARLKYLRATAGFRAAFADQTALPVVAVTAAEKAAKATWGRLMTTRLLLPLAMRSTRLAFSGFMASTDHATPHVEIAGVTAPQRPTNEDALAPAAGVSASVGDLIQFLRMELGGGRLDGAVVTAPAQIAETRNGVTAMGADGAGPRASALGWQTSSLDGRLVVSRDGSLDSGFSSLVSMVPGDGVGVIVLTNAFPRGRALAQALTNTLYDLYLTGSPQRDWFAEQTQATAAAAVAAAASRRPLPLVPPAGAAGPRPASVYTGTYVNAYYGVVRVTGSVRALSIKLGRGLSLACAPWSGDTWRQPDGSAVSFVVRSGSAAAVRLAALALPGRDATFTRVP